MKRVVFIFLIVLSWFHLGCDFQNPADFKMPTWNWNLTLPLIQNKYPLADIVNDSTIQTAGDSLFIQFNGDLPKDSVNEDFLKIPLNLTQEASTEITPPNISEVFSGVTVSMTLPIPVGEFLNGNVVNIADSPNMVSIPSSSEQQIMGASWNFVASTIESALGDTTIEINLFSFDDVFGQIEIIESIQGVLVGGAAEDNRFSSSFENTDFPATIPIDSSWSIVISGTDTLASHKNPDISSGETDADTTSLVQKMLGELLEIKTGFKLTRVADTDTVTIPANTSLDMSVTMSMTITDIKEAVVVFKETSLVPPLDPIAFSSSSTSSEDCQVRGIYSGVFDSPTSSSVNSIGYVDVKNTFPFNINFSMKLKNFISTTNDTLQFSEILSSDGTSVSDNQKLDGWTFKNPTDPTKPVEEIDVQISANSVAGTDTIRIDGTEEEWGFDFAMNVLPLYFSTLEADLDCPFPPQEQEIAGVPQGFTGMSFDEVILQFTMFNEIRLPITLDLDMVGISSMGDSVNVAVSSKLANPVSVTDTAKTIIQLSSVGTKVELYDSVSDTLPDSSYTSLAGIEDNTIVDLLALNPSDFIVNATAGIDGRGAIDVNKAIWGNYELIAPFKVRIEPITFIPQKATDFAEISHATRSMLRSSLKATTLVTHVKNGLPTGGVISILFSNRNLFPLDRDASTLSFFADSLKTTAAKFISGDTESFTSFGFGSDKTRLANIYQNMDSLRVVTSCYDLNMVAGDINVFDVLPDTSDCKDNTAYLVASFADTTERVISYVDTFFQVLLPTPESFFGDTATVGIPGAVEQAGDTIFYSELDSNNIFHLTDIGSHFVNNRTHFFGSGGEAVFFTMKDTLEIEAMVSFTLESTGLLEEAEDEIVITYPNGGETFSIGDTVTIKWRSLGSVKNSSVEVFSATDTSAGGPSEWTSISGGSITNVDSLDWIPSVASDVIIFRVCNEGETVCDESASYSTVEASRLANQSSVAKRSKNGIQSGKIR